MDEPDTEERWGLWLSICRSMVKMAELSPSNDLVTLEDARRDLEASEIAYAVWKARQGG